MPTRPSTSPTTAVSRSSATGLPCARRWACTATTSSTTQVGEPFDKVPEISRRGRAFPVWAVLRSLGRDGVADLVDGFCEHARTFADGIADIDGAEVLNDVEFTQVCAAFGDDDRTRAVVDAMLADGTAWTTGSRWRGRAVLRVSVSNWSTTAADVEASLDALRRAAAR